MKIKSVEFISLSACTMILTALGIDVMLPALGAVREHFGLPPESTATGHIIEFFFLGQIAQIVFGTLSDRFGRLPILRIGFPLYIAGGVMAAFAPSLNIIFAARFMAGVGASAVLMTTIAGVRDRFKGDEMARIMSLILTIFLFTPVVAPFLGLAVLSFASWRMVFLTPPLFAVVVFLWSLRLEESLPRDQRTVLRLNDIVQSIRNVVGNGVFIRYTAITTLLFTALSSYVSSAEHIIGEIYHKPERFAWIFAGIGLLMSMFALSNSHFSSRFGARRTIKWMISIYTLVATFLLIFTLTTTNVPDMTVFFVSLALLLGMNLAVEPNCSALAMEPMGDTAGTASAVYGTSFFFVGASLGSVISYLMKENVFPLVLSFFLIGVIATILIFTDSRPLERNAR